MTALRSLRGALALAVLALVAGCASVPSKPLTDIRAIEGKWRGTITVGMGAPQFYYLPVNPDSTIGAEWGPNWQWRKITLSGGQTRFSFPTSSGDLYYYEEAEGRVITLRPEFGGWDAQVRPLK